MVYPKLLGSLQWKVPLEASWSFPGCWRKDWGCLWALTEPGLCQPKHSTSMQLIDFQWFQLLGTECLTPQTWHNTFSRCCATHSSFSADTLARSPAFSHLRGEINEIQSNKNNAGERRQMKNEYSKAQFGRVLSGMSGGWKCLSVSLSHLLGTWELCVILNCLGIPQKALLQQQGLICFKKSLGMLFLIEMWHF